MTEVTEAEIQEDIVANVKVWCKSRMIPYMPEGLHHPIPKEEHDSVPKTEGMKFAYQYKGNMIYGYYIHPQTIYANERASESGNRTSSGTSEPVKHVDTNANTSQRQLSMVGGDAIEALLKDVEQLESAVIHIRNFITDIVYAKAQAPISKSKGKQSPTRRRRNRSIPSIPHKTSEHEDSTSRLSPEEPTGLLL